MFTIRAVPLRVKPSEGQAEPSPSTPRDPVVYIICSSLNPRLATPKTSLTLRSPSRCVQLERLLNGNHRRPRDDSLLSVALRIPSAPNPDRITVYMWQCEYLTPEGKQTVINHVWIDLLSYVILPLVALSVACELWLNSSWSDARGKRGRIYFFVHYQHRHVKINSRKPRRGNAQSHRMHSKNLIARKVHNIRSLVTMRTTWARPVLFAAVHSYIYLSIHAYLHRRVQMYPYSIYQCPSMRISMRPTFPTLQLSNVVCCCLWLG